MPESLLPPERLPSHTTTCMGCGPDNPHGLRLVVHRSGDAVYTDVTFDERHIGARAWPMAGQWPRHVMTSWASRCGSPEPRR